jgi:hypothetical protein
MEAARKFFGDELIDHPVARHPGLTCKFVGHDEHTKMTFACPWRRPVARVHLALVDDIKPHGLKSDHELFS